MRCKKHYTDLSSAVGVCASCLRERLFRLIVAQEQAQAQLISENHCNLDTNSAFPRSVSPYINRRKSDNSEAPVAAAQRPYNKPRLNHSLSDQRFYYSPQVALSTGGCIGVTSSNRKKQSLIRLSSFSNLFRSSNRNGETDSVHRVSASSSRETCGAGGNPTSSPSWFSNVFTAGGRRQKNKTIIDESSTIAASGVVRKQRCVRDRGMSPVRHCNENGVDEFSDGSSGYESTEAESCKQTPRKTPAHHTIRRGGGQRSVSEMIFCLSPLVRVSPNRSWSHKGRPPADGCDTRPPAVPHLSYAKSFCANRSRKLADFGRSDPNR